MRWKQAEWLALAGLCAEDKQRITPLVEITPRSVAPRKRRVSIESMLQKNAADLRRFWGTEAIFIDLVHLGHEQHVSNGGHPFPYLASEVRDVGVSMIPVTGLNRDSLYQSSLQSIQRVDQRGVCIRLSPSDIRTGISEQLRRLLPALELTPEDVDLILDYQVVGSFEAAYARHSSVIPDLSRWRTFTITSGAFPKDLTGLDVGSHFLPRADWIAWRSAVLDRSWRLRIPTFGDYAIQFGRYEEPPDRPNFSASIRYTLEDEWLVMRGEGVFHEGSPGFAQWPAQAQLLCSRGDYCGSGFSEGDSYIYQKSINQIPPGNARTWLQAGLNHHFAFVVRQISSPLGL